MIYSTTTTSFCTMIKWYKTLTINQRICLKAHTTLFLGRQWEYFLPLFTPRERLIIVYEKLILDGIISN